MIDENAPNKSNTYAEVQKKRLEEIQAMKQNAKANM